MSDTSAIDAFYDAINEDFENKESQSQVNEMSGNDVNQQQSKSEEKQEPELNQKDSLPKKEDFQQNYPAEFDRQKYDQEISELKAKYNSAQAKLSAFEEEKTKASQAKAEANLKQFEDEWAAFAEEFPDFAKPMNAAMERMKLNFESRLAELTKAKQEPQKPIEKNNQQEQNTLQDYALKTFNELHPDASKYAWSEEHEGKKVIKYAPEFTEWLSTLAPEEARKTKESDELPFVVAQFNKFKEWKNQKDDKKKRQENSMKGRVNQAVLPIGNAAPRKQAMTAEDAFMAEINS